MTFRPASMLVIALSITASACHREPAAPATDPAVAPSISAAAPAADTAPAGTDETRVLTGHHWKLENARTHEGARISALFARRDQPITIDFAEGRVGVSETCNRMGGAYAIEGNTLRISRLASTMMACADSALMALDQEVAKRLEGESRWSLDAANPPTLSLRTAGGDTLNFRGEPTAETRYGGTGERVFLEVAPQRKPCSHPLIPDAKCLQVREIHFDDAGIKQAAGEWSNFYEAIEGYTHEDGVRNVLRVKRFTRTPVPADASANVYVLDMVVESENTAR